MSSRNSEFRLGLLVKQSERICAKGMVQSIFACDHGEKFLGRTWKLNTRKNI